MINAFTPYFGKDGTPTVEGIKLLDGLERRLSLAERKLEAIAAITAPTGGATIDAQARTAINAIIAGAN